MTAPTTAPRAGKPRALSAIPLAHPGRRAPFVADHENQTGEDRVGRSQRQERVLDVLSSLANKLQIIVLTCHEDRYRGVGQRVSLPL